MILLSLCGLCGLYILHSFQLYLTYVFLATQHHRFDWTYADRRPLEYGTNFLITYQGFRRLYL